ncbi:GntR family transcriptional regulator [Halomonas sp. LR3S48]|uniref:GntR family transcriptional regulator n=1 Tax=Halomonadaceae TaxID=28256 RepID=UPI0021E4E6B6|nr:GntR family transcriptional regulator [Halomonas sp. LR3S48]UYG04426.1 GntR family transcriptional regulator [Halomonas sp. LR3S48]
MLENTTSQAHAAYRILESMIVTLKLRPGSVVTEKKLIDIVGLGRTPVREALQKLSWEGLIEIKPRAGVMVADIRPEDYLRVMEPRLVLEPLLARSAARYGDATHRARLAECAQAMQESARQQDIEGFLQADKEFDETLDQACDNRYLSKVLAPLQTHSRRFWFRFGSSQGPDISAGYHVKVMEAIERAEEDLAEQTMRELMQYLRQVAIDLVA